MSKEKNILQTFVDSIRIERKLNAKRPASKIKVLTVEELERIAKAQGVQRRIDYCRRGGK